MGENFKCARCTNCCKHYWITLLPEEARGIAKILRIPLKHFFSKYCLLLLQAFPMRKPDFSNPLMKSIEQFPEKLRKRLSKKTSSKFFLVLPSIAFKRSGKKCAMLSTTGLCKIHAARPMQCKLFPLIGLKEKTSLKKAYSFCKGLKGSERIDLRKNQAHYKRVKAYFELVKNKGFKRAWKQWPSKGIVLLEGEKIAKISEREFFKLFDF